MGTVAFNQEKMNIPDEEDSLFRIEWINYYKPEDIVGKELLVASWFDPSLDGKNSQDYKAIITVGLDIEEQIFYVLDAYIKRQSLDQAMNFCFELKQMFTLQVLAVESNLFQRLLLREFDSLVKERGINLPLRGIHNHLSKSTRISSLSPLVERGKIRFREQHSDQALLVEQLVYFPSDAVHDDGPDALEGVIRTLESQSLSTHMVSNVTDFRAYRELPRSSYPRRNRSWQTRDSFSVFGKQ
jgi:predicted phage terminase large subunit-like protein